ncbi:MMPL family transporter [Streptomyces lunaelactis]|uniref:MMPL family transporter n=1 Tax=Streptomyces lunaelactis TaxID=1535768 RepID=UPI001585A55C|nr:MMPL family transporter [Streptomyces lunaelactis]NUK39907.1 MMPL family transporter [Streptomyces lunaelactis]
MKRLATAPGGRRAKWLFLAAWLIIAMALGPLAGKVADVEDNDANAYLPGNAEAALVNDRLEEFRTDEVIPAVIVYVRDSGITTADRAKAEADRKELAPLVPGGAIEAAAPSKDGKALLLTVPAPYSDEFSDTVNKARDVAGQDVPADLGVKVAGPAGALQDTINVFDELDGTLLLGSAIVVALLLLLIYRSPVLWLVPLISVGFAAVLSQVVTYAGGKFAGLPVDGQSSGLLTVLVFGVGTDYALLLIARYREELTRDEDRHSAMQIALRRSGPAILASAGTIVIGLLCLLLADLNSSRSLGWGGAAGVLCGFLAMVTVLPALLVILGRWVFWPFVPRFGQAQRAGHSGWARVGAAVGRRPRLSWLAATVVMGALALGATGISFGLTQSEMYTTTPESVAGQRLVAAHYPGGSSAPADVIAKASSEKRVVEAVGLLDGVAEVQPAELSRDRGLVHIPVVFEDDPDSPAAERAIDRLRETVHGIEGADALVGGATASELDTQRAVSRDSKLVIPVVLAVVLLVLIALLRALVAPLVLLATVVLSYFGALGASSLLFEHAFDWTGVDHSLPLLGFVFLVALGIDYNIFLMTRVREEVGLLGHVRGVQSGLASTGAVITSAGLVLAATFSILVSLPLVTMAELGVLVGLGVLLDTFLVRSVLVPALSLDIGKAMWWPGSLHRRLSGGDPSAPADSADSPADTARPQGEHIPR